MFVHCLDCLFSVECTGGGIGCWILQDRLDDPIIQLAAIRKLNVELTNEMVDNLNQFLQEIKHKPYRLASKTAKKYCANCLKCQRKNQHKRKQDKYKINDNHQHKEEEKEEREQIDFQPMVRFDLEQLLSSSMLLFYLFLFALSFSASV